MCLSAFQSPWDKSVCSHCRDLSFPLGLQLIVNFQAKDSFLRERLRDAAVVALQINRKWAISTEHNQTEYVFWCMLSEGEPSSDLCVTSVRWTPDRCDISFRKTSGPFSFIHDEFFLHPPALLSEFCVLVAESASETRKGLISKIQRTTWPDYQAHTHSKLKGQSDSQSFFFFFLKKRSTAHRWWMKGFHFLSPSSSVCLEAGRTRCGSRRAEDEEAASWSEAPPRRT